MTEEDGIDLERNMTPSAKQYTGCQPPLRSEASRQCAVAVQYSNGRAVLINVTIKEDVNGNLIFYSAKDQLCRALAKDWYQRIVGKLFLTLIVGTARVSQVIHFDSPPSRLYLHGFIPEPLLTEALDNPHLLFQPGDGPYKISLFGSPQLINAQCPAYYQPSQTLNADNDMPTYHQPSQARSAKDEILTRTFTDTDNQEIIIVKRIIDRAKVAWLLISLLLLSPTLGLIVGVCAHNAEVGIAISAGVFALATFVQGLIAWVHG